MGGFQTSDKFGDSERIVPKLGSHIIKEALNESLPINEGLYPCMYRLAKGNCLLLRNEFYRRCILFKPYHSGGIAYWQEGWHFADCSIRKE